MSERQSKATDREGLIASYAAMNAATASRLTAQQAPSERLAGAGKPSPTGQRESGEVVTLPREDAQALLDGLNARIDAAIDGGGDTVPVFTGIVALHEALAAIDPAQQGVGK